MSAKIGRPKLPAKEKRQVYPLRLSAAELQSYEDAAIRADMKCPAWMRSVLTKEAAKT